MSGNICRCGAYPNIVAAVQDVPAQAEEADRCDLPLRQRAATSTARRERADGRRRRRFLAGGTTLVDLMKLGVEQPDALVDINALAARPRSRVTCRRRLADRRAGAQ